MKKILPLLALAGLALTSCGGSDGNGKTTPDPLAQTLNLSGQVENTMPAITGNLPLKTYFWGQSLAVGNITPAGAVTASITSANVASGPKKSLNDWNTDWSTDCNPSGLKISNTQYFSTSRLHYILNDQDYYVYPRTIKNNGDGTSSYTVYSFWYAVNSGAITGHLVCGNYDDTYNVVLQPGWNVVAETYTYTAATDKFSNSTYATVSHATSYSGTWGTLKAE